jgi:predicted metal-dependent phosphoesterase TrpH
VIDLHTHTTASDGRCTPSELVARATAAGVTVLAVTDHDTVGGIAAAQAASQDAGIDLIPGIEITAIQDDVDVHVLGYFISPSSSSLRAFLDEQRRHRIDRVRGIVARLATFGVELDVNAIVRPAIDDEGKSAGRPWVARALVDAGHVSSTAEAFDRWLARGKPAFVPRTGFAAPLVIARIHEAGGVASLAHPALIGRDEWIEELVAAGLDAVEAYHSEHDEVATARYVAMARTLGVLVTGGSDFHGDASHGAAQPGSTSLPREDYNKLLRASGGGTREQGH